jgi:AcrR family transcriptional regulator
MPRRKPLVSPARQQRSRDTHDNIVQAFRALLASEPFEKISVAQIAKRAGSSVGGVYARFASKDALLIPVIDDILTESTVALDLSLDAVSGPGHSLANIVAAYVEPMIAMFRRHRTVLLQVTRAARGDTARSITDRLHEFNAHAHGRFRTLAWAHREEITESDPRSAIEFALFFGSAAGREAMLGANWRSYEIEPEDATVARELAETMIAYLTAPPPKASRRKR